MSTPVLSEINIYPVKSLKGHQVDSAEVQPRGLQHDRRWMVVDADGKFITQRELPRMALLSPVIEGTDMVIGVSGAPAFTVPLVPPDNAALQTVRVWRSVCDAVPAGDKADRWLSQFLGIECRLVQMPETTRREVNPDYAIGEGIVSFADGYPIMLIGQSSLDDLNSRLANPLPMDRFRPSLVVSGTTAFEEDTWKTIRVGETIFHVVKPCDRCVMTTIDQATGERVGQEPLKTLATYRLRDQKILFGMQMIPAGNGTLHVGDTVEVLEAVAPPGD